MSLIETWLLIIIVPPSLIWWLIILNAAKEQGRQRKQMAELDDRIKVITDRLNQVENQEIEYDAGEFIDYYDELTEAKLKLERLFQG